MNLWVALGLWVATPTFGHAGSPNWISRSTLGQVKCLEISKELIRECVTCLVVVAACHSCIIIWWTRAVMYAKIHYSPPKGGAFAPPLPPLNPPLLTNMHSDLRSNPSSGLCINVYELFYVCQLIRILWCNQCLHNVYILLTPVDCFHLTHLDSSEAIISRNAAVWLYSAFPIASEMSLQLLVLYRDRRGRSYLHRVTHLGVLTSSQSANTGWDNPCLGRLEC